MPLLQLDQDSDDEFEAGRFEELRPAGEEIGLPAVRLDGVEETFTTQPLGVRVREPEDPVTPRDGPLRVATWNIWFDKMAMRERTKAIVDIVAEAADVACFQEVTPRALATIREHRWVRQHCWLTDAEGATLGGYGVTIVSRFPIRAAVLWRLPTHMGRSLLAVDVETPSGPVRVGCVHLESVNNARLRRAQVQLSAAALLQPPTLSGTVLCGDFNFDSTRNWGKPPPSAEAPGEPLENEVLREQLREWADAWPATHPPEQPGWTFDSVTNAMLAFHPREERMRYDRVMVHRRGLRVRASELLGTGPVVAEQRESVYPYYQIHDAELAERYKRDGRQRDCEELDRAPVLCSDHFGVCAVLEHEEACAR